MKVKATVIVGYARDYDGAPASKEFDCDDSILELLEWASMLENEAFDYVSPQILVSRVIEYDS